MENELSLDLLEVFHALQQTSFPVVMVINCCRIIVRENTVKQFSIPNLSIPDNIFVSWGACHAKAAVDGKFIEEWRRSLHDIEFKNEHLDHIAAKIKLNCQHICKTQYINAFQSEYPCIGGIFTDKDEEM